MARLILIEGIPGSGKTTLAKGLAALFAGAGFPCAAWPEGAPEHPVELEWHACLTQEEYAALLRDFPEDAGSAAARAQEEGGRVLVRYRGADGAFLFRGPLLARLCAREFRYAETPCIPFRAYAATALSRWGRFAAQWADRPGAVILESAFLQRPVQDMLLHYALAEGEITRYLHRAAEALRPLSPTLFYLLPGDIPAVLTHAAAERGAPEMVLPDSIAFWQRRQAIELAILPQLPFARHLLPREGETPEATARRMALLLGIAEG